MTCFESSFAVLSAEVVRFIFFVTRRQKIFTEEGSQNVLTSALAVYPSDDFHEFKYQSFSFIQPESVINISGSPAVFQHGVVQPSFAYPGTVDLARATVYANKIRKIHYERLKNSPSLKKSIYKPLRLKKARVRRERNTWRQELELLLKVEVLYAKCVKNR